MRKLTDHIVNPANDRLRIEVLDDPALSGANHLYGIQLPSQAPDGATVLRSSGVTLAFQNGPIGVDGNGVNGLTHEALIAVLIDRLRGFQRGPYVCRENAVALTKLEEALMWLGKRTRDRMARGIEGTHEV